MRVLQESYRIYVQKSLGHGGYGIVYKAALVDKGRSDKHICLKVVRVNLRVLAKVKMGPI